MCGFCREYEDTYLRCPSMDEMTFSKIETGTHHKRTVAVVTRYRVFETRKVGQEENMLRPTGNWPLTQQSEADQIVSCDVNKNNTTWNKISLRMCSVFL